MLNVVVNDASLEKNKRGSITGEIHWEIENACFPDNQWNDFIVVVLAWWNKAAALLRSSSVGTSAEFNFMDGPYYIRGTKKDEANVTLSFIRRTLDGEENLLVHDTDMLELKRSIEEASKQILKAVEDRSWKSDDIIELKRSLK
ncbi:hypothetical protein DUZ99_15590 [Xylanibacillus composti]|uniref:Uncharacterized protein n=1 Tax=Xylanibacillus composti TaxID=1572762 RepID=A0A8J4M4Q0_9BACL|nr:hypothetical protein [Xylanibacillus composti]MDT9726406.1 hypothetical protein [Xylanibacillus composti]GIQ71542.1 hypothetical protein XYCOK13_43660 [Xylanibacillus composti]